MATPFDIVGLLHIGVTSAIASINAIKQVAVGYQEVCTLVAHAEEKSKRIQSSLALLHDLAGLSGMKSDFFVCSLGQVRIVESSLSTIKEELRKNSTIRTAFSSSSLIHRLGEVNQRLEQLDNTFSTVGMIGVVVSEQLKTRLDNGTEELAIAISRTLSPSLDRNAARSLLGDLQANTNAGAVNLGRRKPTKDLLSSEQESQIYLSLGTTYFEGKPTRNFVRAAQYFHYAYSKGRLEAAYYLGMLHQNGQGVTKSLEKAFHYFSISAEFGEGRGLKEYGECFAYGRGTDVDFDKAVKCVKLSADLRDPGGMRNLGYCYLHGRGMRQNWWKAVKLLKAARAGGDKKSCVMLAYCFEKGIVVRRDTTAAYDLLLEAHKGGHTFGTERLARCYRLGLGTQKNLERAAELYRQCYERSGWRRFLFGPMYGYLLARGEGVPKNARLGIRIVRELLHESYAVGNAVLGDCYRYGVGVRQDSLKAARCYRQAIKGESGIHGILAGHFALASMYEQGEGVLRNDTAAASHFIFAAERMHDLALWKAGSLFESGVGVEAHDQRSFHYFKLAAMGGHVEAQRKAGEYYLKGIGVQRDRGAGIQMLEEAARNGCLDAKNLLRKLGKLRLIRRDRKIRGSSS